LAHAYAIDQENEFQTEGFGRGCELCNKAPFFLGFLWKGRPHYLKRLGTAVRGRIFTLTVWAKHIQAPIDENGLARDSGG
jgi:hypothetical protein